MWLEFEVFGQLGRQILLGLGPHQPCQVSLLVEFMPDRERFAPEVLAAEQPVAELEVDRRVSLAGAAEVFNDPVLGAVDLQPVQKPTVDCGSVAGVGLAGEVFGRFDRANDRQVEDLGEFPVAFVLSGNCHDRPGAVADQHVIGDPDRDLLVVDRVDGVGAGEDAGLLLGQVGAVEVALGGGLGLVGGDRLALEVGRQAFDERVFGSNHHVGGSEQRVGSGGVDPQHLLTRIGRQSRLFSPVLPESVCGVEFVGRLSGFPNIKVDFRACASPDPVPLQQPDRLGPVDQVESVEQAIGVAGDCQHPLPQGKSFDRVLAPFALSVDDFLVGQHRAQRGAPVDRGLVLVGQAVTVLVSTDRFVTIVGDRVGDRQLADRAATSDSLEAVGPGPLALVVIPRVEQL